MNPIRILIIEDSIVSALLMEAQIVRKEPEFQVSIRKTLRGGLQQCEISRPDVIILDLGLPDATPEESVRQIPKLCEYGKVIAVTASNEMEAATRAAGASDFMIKALGEDSNPFIERIIRLIPDHAA